MNKLQGTLGTYDLVETEDRSVTLYSSAFDENCHSTAGAYAETIYNFVDGCQVLSRKKNTIFEVGFGLGLGLKATIEEFERNELLFEGTFISTEIDPWLVQWAASNTEIKNPELNFQYNNLKLFHEKDFSFYCYEKSNLRIIVLLGDARKVLPLAKQHLTLNDFTAIYQDAFSPKKNPALWTVEWFKLLKELSHSSSRLSTYSASSSVRKTLHQAGWSVQNRPGFGKKRSATIAVLEDHSDPEIVQSFSSPKIAVLKDQDLPLLGSISKS